MKPSSGQEQPPHFYQPPPPYSLPGQPLTQQQAPIQMQPKDYPTATAPPPPGLHTPNSSNVQTQQPMIIYSTTPVSYGPYPMRFTCTNCNAQVMTETHSKPGLLTYILSGMCLFLAPYLCCCLVPCCVRECKDIEHRCPSCQHKLGLFKRI